jgi:hypothetical protein
VIPPQKNVMRLREFDRRSRVHGGFLIRVACDPRPCACLIKASAGARGVRLVVGHGSRNTRQNPSPRPSNTGREGGASPAERLPASSPPRCYADLTVPAPSRQRTHPAAPFGARIRAGRTCGRSRDQRSRCGSALSCRTKRGSGGDAGVSRLLNWRGSTTS